MIAFRRLRYAVVMLGLAGIVSAPANAQTYPSQNVSVIVAFAAGGIADALGRLVGQKLSERLNQSVVIENRGGAGGNLAARAVATAAADGHTLLATTTALAVNDTASKNRGYNTADLRAVAIVAISPDVLAVHPSNPAKPSAAVPAHRKFHLQRHLEQSWRSIANLPVLCSRTLRCRG